MPEKGPQKGSCGAPRGSVAEGIKSTPSQLSSCAFTGLFLGYILKCRIGQNHSMPCRNLGEFYPPTTPMGCCKFCTEIKKNKDHVLGKTTWCLV